MLVFATLIDGLFPFFSVTMDNFMSPYYINPSNHIGKPLVSQPLLPTINNFDSCQCTIQIDLGTKNKVGFVDGTIPQPAANDSLYPPSFATTLWRLGCCYR